MHILITTVYLHCIKIEINITFTFSEHVQHIYIKQGSQ
jgi:hypothetical protein